MVRSQKFGDGYKAEAVKPRESNQTIAETAESRAEGVDPG